MSAVDVFEQRTPTGIVIKELHNLLINLCYFEAIRCFEQGEKTVKVTEFTCHSGFRQIRF